MSLLKAACSQIGQKEIEGKSNNPTIVNYAKECGFEWVNDDETPWCSIFMNWVTLKSGYERTNKANARSWLDVGLPILMPETGDIVIFKRGNSEWKGHVAIFMSFDGNYAWVLGGNQSNQVKVSKYNLEDVLGYRRLSRA